MCPIQGLWLLDNRRVLCAVLLGLALLVLNPLSHSVHEEYRVREQPGVGGPPSSRRLDFGLDKVTQRQLKAAR